MNRECPEQSPIRKIASRAALLIMLLLIVVLGYDLSQVQQARREAELARDRERLRAELIIISSPYAIIACDDKQKIKVSNLAAEQLFGWQSGDLLGKDVKVLIPDDLQTEHLRSSIEAAASARRVPGDWMFRKQMKATAVRKDGSTIEIDLNIRAIKYGEMVEFIAAMKQSNQPFAKQEVIELPKIEPRIEASQEMTKKEIVNEEKKEVQP